MRSTTKNYPIRSHLLFKFKIDAFYGLGRRRENNSQNISSKQDQDALILFLIAHTVLDHKAARPELDESDHFITLLTKHVQRDLLIEITTSLVIKPFVIRYGGSPSLLITDNPPPICSVPSGEAITNYDPSTNSVKSITYACTGLNADSIRMIHHRHEGQAFERLKHRITKNISLDPSIRFMLFCYQAPFFILGVPVDRLHNFPPHLKNFLGNLEGKFGIQQQLRGTNKYNNWLLHKVLNQPNQHVQFETNTLLTLGCDLNKKVRLQKGGEKLTSFQRAARHNPIMLRQLVQCGASIDTYHLPPLSGKALWELASIENERQGKRKLIRFIALKAVLCMSRRKSTPPCPIRHSIISYLFPTPPHDHPIEDHTESNLRRPQHVQPVAYTNGV